MPFVIVRKDITKMTVDAIVNDANETLLGGGGVSDSIHRAAGRELMEACRTLGGCEIGHAKMTGGYKLPCQYVIHTVGPRYRGGEKEKALLVSCYKESLQLAKEHRCETVAFPLISSGANGYPRDQVLRVATQVIRDFLLENDMTVYIVMLDKTARSIRETRFSYIARYIDDHYVERYPRRRERACMSAPAQAVLWEDRCEGKTLSAEDDLDARLRQMDESFSQMLLRKIDEKGITDAECYKKANVDRKLFSKIRSDLHYKPSKPTVLAFAISLELSLEETEDMLRKAGFALSHSNKFDVIIEYFISRGNYNIFEINEALFAFDQSLLGA